MPSVGVGGQQARNFMGTYGYNDWEQKSWEETVLAEIRVRRMYKKSRSDWHSGTGDNEMIVPAVCLKVESHSE